MLTQITVLGMGVLLAASVAAPAWAEDGNFSRQVKKPVREAIDSRQATQKAEEKWRDERHKLLAVYEKLQLDQKQLKDRKERLQQEIVAARERLELKEKQLQDMAQISIQVNPFLQELVGHLRQLVSGSMPFLASEREQRITRLAGLLEDSEAPVSEKFRKAMEALQAEAEYGSTVEVYQQTIGVDGTPSLVNVFRLGRISLFYQTLDQKRSGYYDVAADAWQPLPNAFNRSIQTAIDIGAKRKPVEILTLPLGRITGR